MTKHSCGLNKVVLFIFLLAPFSITASQLPSQTRYRLSVIRQIHAIGHIANHLGQMADNRALKLQNPEMLKLFEKNCHDAEETFKGASVLSDSTYKAALLVHNILVSFHDALEEKDPFFKEHQEEGATENLEALLQSNDGLINVVRKQMETAGLSWWNQAMRSIDGMSDRFKVLPIAKRIGLYGILGYFGFNLKDDAKEVYQWATQFGLPENSTSNQNDRKQLSKGVSIWSSLSDIPLQAVKRLGVEAFIMTQISDDVKDVLNWTKEKATMAYRYLRGGHFVAPLSRAKAPLYTFDDVIGLNSLKIEFQKVIEFLKNPEYYSRANIAIDRGYIFSGPEGSSKAFLAHAFTGEINKELKKQQEIGNFRFIEINASEILNDGITKVFKDAQTYAPCVLFVNDIETLNLAGNKELSGEFFDHITRALDKDRKHQVVMIASTNKPESITPLLKQQGLLSKVLEFTPPGFDDRRKFFEKRLKDQYVNTADFDFDKLALDTEGCSYGKLVKIFRKSLLKADQRKEPISQKHFEKSVDQNVRNIFELPLTIPQNEIDLIASYLAAQAVMHEVLDAEGTLSKVTLYPIFHEQKVDKENPMGFVYGKIFIEHGYDRIPVNTGLSFVKKAKMLLAGLTGQIIFNKSSSGYRLSEREEAFQTAQGNAYEGIPKENFSREQIMVLNEKAWEIFKGWESEVKTLVEKYKDTIEKVIQKLKDKKTLLGTEIIQMVQEGQSALGV